MTDDALVAHINFFEAAFPGYEVIANIPFVIRYTIENNIITNHWMLADQMMMM